MAKSVWNTWHLLTDHKMVPVPTDAGAYVIAAREPISRAVGVDSLGILDIGEAVNLRKRISSFLACAEGRRKKGHSAGRRYCAIGMTVNFLLDQLHFKMYKASSKKKAYEEEGRLLAKYLKSHKELPPLNFKSNRKGSMA